MNKFEAQLIFDKFEEVILQGNYSLAITSLKVILESTNLKNSKIWNEFILVSSQFHENESNYHGNTIDYDVYSRVKSKSILSLLNISQNACSYITVDNDANGKKGDIGVKPYVIDELTKIGIDLLLLLETRTQSKHYEANLLNRKIMSSPIEKYYHRFVVNKSDLYQEVIIEGLNLLDEPLTGMTFVASSSIPSTFVEMEVTAHCLVNNHELKVLCKDSDSNNSKRLFVHYRSPISKGERYKVFCKFKLSDTMKLSGSDFLTIFINREEIVKSFHCVIEFVEKCPEFILSLDINKKVETLLYPNNNYENLNTMRILFTYSL
jgi:hypothetical protein